MSKNKAAKDPCWEGYEMVGMKKKGGKDVPNCVPVKSNVLVEQLFKPGLVETVPEYKSRERIIKMKPSLFLKLAKPLRNPRKESLDGIADAVDRGEKLRELPFLMFARDEEGGAKVTGHEGRHRALFFQQEGYDYMPVRLIGDIRWSQQGNKDNLDYVENWPIYLASEEGSIKYKFPVSREQSSKPYATLASSTFIKFNLVNELLARVNSSSTNTVTLDIMLLTRLLEKAREDIKTDADLHFLVDAVFQAQGGFEDTTLDMEVYDSIVNAHEKLRSANPDSISSDL